MGWSRRSAAFTSDAHRYGREPGSTSSPVPLPFAFLVQRRLPAIRRACALPGSLPAHELEAMGHVKQYRTFGLLSV